MTIRTTARYLLTLATALYAFPALAAPPILLNSFMVADDDTSRPTMNMTFPVFADGMLIFEVENPDATTDGAFYIEMLDSSGTVVLDQDVYTGEVDNPMSYLGETVRGMAYTELITNVSADFEFVELRISYHSEFIGTLDPPQGDTDTLHVFYRPGRSLRTTPILVTSLCSDPQVGDSTSVTFDAPTDGLLVSHRTTTAYGGGAMSFALDGGDWVFSQDTGMETVPEFLAFPVAAGQVDIDIEHIDGTWQDNQDQRCVDLYFMP